MLEKSCALQNIVNCYACVAHTDEKDDPYLSSDSMDFHLKAGFKKAGIFVRCGYKFNRWYDMVWLEKKISFTAERPPEFVPFPLLEQKLLKHIGLFAEK